MALWCQLLNEGTDEGVRLKVGLITQISHLYRNRKTHNRCAVSVESINERTNNYTAWHGTLAEVHLGDAQRLHYSLVGNTHPRRKHFSLCSPAGSTALVVESLANRSGFVGGALDGDISSSFWLVLYTL